MSQPGIWSAPLAADAPVLPEDYATRVDDSFDALLSSHSGITIPPYAVQGTIWHDTTALATAPLNFYDGIADRLIPVEDASGDLTASNGFIATAGNVTITLGDLLITTPQTVVTAADTGVVGTIRWDADYIYVCVATDTWKRVAIATWV